MVSIKQTKIHDISMSWPYVLFVCFFAFRLFCFLFFLIIRRPPISTRSTSSAASDVYKRQKGWYLIDCSFENCCLIFVFIFVSRLILWILKNFSIS